MSKRKYEQVFENEWFRPQHRGFRERCCDCGLIHIVDFRVVDGAVEFRVRVDARATAASRRKKKK